MTRLRISINIFLWSMFLALIIAIADITGISYKIGVLFVNPNFIVDYHFTLCIIVILLIIALISFLFIIFFTTKLLKIIKNELEDTWENEELC